MVTVGTIVVKVEVDVVVVAVAAKAVISHTTFRTTTGSSRVRVLVMIERSDQARIKGNITHDERRSSGNGTDPGSAYTSNSDRDGKQSSNNERDCDHHYRKSTADAQGPGATAVSFRCGHWT